VFGLPAPRLGQDWPGRWNRSHALARQLAHFFFHIERLLLAGHGGPWLRFEYIAAGAENIFLAPCLVAAREKYWDFSADIVPFRTVVSVGI
jgi:hypothetical protein